MCERTIVYYSQKWKVESIENPKFKSNIYQFNAMHAKLLQLRKMEKYYCDLSEIVIDEMIKLSSQIIKENV